MQQAYKAPNGETVIATNDVQAAAFEKAGLEPVAMPKTKKNANDDE